MTRQEIFEKIAQNDINFFREVYYNRRSNKEEVVVLQDENWGDGNDWVVVLHFIESDTIVRLDGYYSSYDSPELEYCSVAVPYQETRWRAVELADIRDMKIDEVTKTDN